LMSVSKQTQLNPNSKRAQESWPGAHQAYQGKKTARKFVGAVYPSFMCQKEQVAYHKRQELLFQHS
jgi:hypothetical protein